MNLSTKERALLKKLESYKHISIRGAIRYWCGDRIAQGLNRDVYVCRHDPEWVVKIQRTRNFDNTIEWSIWEAVMFVPQLAAWFAECLVITEAGLVLVQRRVQHRQKKEYPRKIPEFFTDMKIQNYGWIGERFVCCDYSNVLAMLTGFMTKKLRKARWWVAESTRNVKRGKALLLQTDF